MNIQSLGHVVLKVTDIDRSVRFYTDVLGFREVGRTPSGAMVFFCLAGNHHDFGIQLASPLDPDAEPSMTGVGHVAWKLGTDLESLRQARQWLKTRGVEVWAALDHGATKSLYFSDPDGHTLEVFVESEPSVWREDPGIVASGAPLTL